MVVIGIELAVAFAISTFAVGGGIGYLMGKNKKIDADGDGVLEKDEIKAAVKEVLDTADAYRDAVNDILEDNSIDAEDALKYLKNINEIFDNRK